MAVFTTDREFTVVIGARQKLRLPPIAVSNTVPHHVVRSQQIIDALTANVPPTLLSSNNTIGDVPISVRWANTATFASFALEANSAAFLNGVSEFQAGNNITFTGNGTAVVISSTGGGGGNSAFAEHSNTSNTANTANFLNGVSGFNAGNNITFTANGMGFDISANGDANNAISALTALLANNSLFLNGQPDTFYLNVSNFLTGTLNAALLPVANTSVNGVVDTIAQSFAGVKTFTSNAEFSGYANIAGALVVAGNSSLANTNVGGNLVVSGNATLSGFANVLGVLQATGANTLLGNTTVNGWLNVAQTLQVAGLSTLTGNVTMSGFANIAGSLQVTGNTLLTGNVTINGANIVFNGNDMNVTTGNLTVGDTLTANTIVISGQILAGGTNTSGNADFHANVHIYGHLGVGGNPDANAAAKFYGQYVSPLINDGNSGAAFTIDWDLGNEHYLVLTANCTLTLSHPQDGGRYMLEANSGAGQFVITWPAAVLWPDGRTPVQSQYPNKTDIYVLTWNANISKYLGSYNQNFG